MKATLMLNETVPGWSHWEIWLFTHWVWLSVRGGHAKSGGGIWKTEAKTGTASQREMPTV